MKEPEAISEIRSGLAGGRYEGCGGYGCYNHTWHMEDALAAYDTIVAERDDWKQKCSTLESVVRGEQGIYIEEDGYEVNIADLRARLAACERVVEAAKRYELAWNTAEDTKANRDTYKATELEQALVYALRSEYQLRCAVHDYRAAETQREE